MASPSHLDPRKILEGTASKQLEHFKNKMRYAAAKMAIEPVMGL
jgi:hypothetical protein